MPWRSGATPSSCGGERGTGALVGRSPAADEPVTVPPVWHPDDGDTRRGTPCAQCGYRDRE